MQLSDFNTLAEAQAHTVTSYLDVDGDWLGQYFTVLGIANTIKAAQSNTATVDLIAGKPTTVGQLATFLVETVASGKDFGIDPTTTKGQYFRLIMGEILARGLLSQSEHDFIFSSHTVIDTPFANATIDEFLEAKDAGETIVLPSVLGKHSIRVNSTVQPTKPTTLIIEHRFGTDVNNTTDWHEVGSVRNVFYPTSLKGAPYESGQIPATKAAYRELRLVSPLSLGVSIV